MLDTRTVAVMVVLMIVTTSLVHLVNWRLHPQIRGAQWWFAGSLTQVGGVVLLLLRGRISDALSIVLANLLLVVGLMMLAHGTRRFAGLQSGRWLYPAAAAGLLVGFLVFTYAQPSLVGRWWAFGLCTAVVLSTSLQAQWSVGRREGWLGVGGYSVASVGVIAVMLGIPAGLSMHQPQLQRVYDESFVISWGFALFAVLLTMQSFGRVLMTANRIQQELQRMALLDGLTGLPNRRAFDDALQRAAAAARRAKAPLGLLLLDIDHFKRINDSHGHPEGDAVLRQVAQRLAGVCRPTDFPARVGGEEFAVILQAPSQEALREVAERVRQVMGGEPMRVAGEPRSVTVSVGAARHAAAAPGSAPDSTPDSTPEETQRLYASADQALYAAKQGGRDCVHVFEESAQ